MRRPMEKGIILIRLARKYRLYLIAGFTVILITGGVLVLPRMYAGVKQGIAEYRETPAVYMEVRANYPGDRIESLVACATDESHSISNRDAVIRILGLLEDRQALPALESLYTGEACDHSRTICQYNIRKSIDKINNPYKDFVGKWLARRLQPEVYGT